MATDQLHNEAESLQSSLDGNIGPLITESSTLDQECQKSVPNNMLTTEEIENRSAVCSRLKDAAGPIRTKFDAVSSGLAHLERVYQEQRTKQELLLQQGQNLQ